MLAAVLILSNTAMAQTSEAESDWSSKTKTFPVYDPYPPGILPADLSSELARVLREVDVIEARALAQWQAQTPPVLTGQPPTLQGTGTAAHPCTVLPRTAVQPGTGRFLRRQLLGFTRDRVSAAKC
jgi:hypothetical protein